LAVLVLVLGAVMLHDDKRFEHIAKAQYQRYLEDDGTKRFLHNVSRLFWDSSNIVFNEPSPHYVTRRKIMLARYKRDDWRYWFWWQVL